MNEEKERKEDENAGSRTPNRADYLADVFRVWDCDEQEWLGSAPVVLRFEGKDVLVGADTTRDLAHDLAAEAPVSGNACSKHEDAADEPCLCWRGDRAFTHLIGSKMNLHDALKSIRSVLELHAAEARFIKICSTPAGEMKAAGLKST